MPAESRLGQALNAGLHAMMAQDSGLYVLGEDIADPYGGAFKITKGLTTAYPDRALTTPISENAIVGVANGLALSGNRVVVEMMFGDFIALAFDQIVNFAAKAVHMYGHEQRLPLVVRCPVGGRRGYGPTHSQSLQKHFIGVPGLDLYELSTVHDPRSILQRALDRGRPAIVFEQKVLYGQRLHQPGAVDDMLTCRPVDDNWVRVGSRDDAPPRAVLIAGGAIAEECMTAQRALLADGVRVDLLVPARIYPLDLEPVLPFLAGAGLVAVAEEGTAGGTWGAEVAATLHERLWGTLRRPVRLMHSADRPIPAAAHLEARMLLQPADIAAGLAELISTAAPVQASAAPEETADSSAVVLARLNTNDTEYVLLDWLVADGAEVAEGDEIAEVETSKTVEAIPAHTGGVLRHALAVGAACKPGQRIGSIGGSGATTPFAAPSPAAAAAAPAADVIMLSPAQRRVAQVVTASRRTIPDAYVLRQVELAAFDAVNATQLDAGGEPLGLLETLIVAVGRLHAAHPLCYATLDGEEALRLAGTVNVGVTLDAGRGLYVPVVRGADRRPLPDLADDLAELRMGALRGELTEQQLSDANIAVSWNHEPGVLMVQPVIPPGLACTLAVGGRLDTVAVRDGQVVARPVVNLGLAHDHRIVNGREAAAYLAALAAFVQDEPALTELARTAN